MANRSRASAVLCPRCGKLVSADAEFCIHCGQKRPGAGGARRWVRQAFGGELRAVPALILMCAILYVLSLVIDPGALLHPRGLAGFLAPSMGSLERLGMTGAVALFRGRWWTLITAIYLHGSLLHLIFNLLWIRQLGPMVEDLFGTPRLLLLFTVSGATGMLFSGLLGVAFTIGASGSIFGLMGALVSYGRRQSGLLGPLLYRQLLVWAMVLLAMGFFMPGVNNVAHVVGFGSGFLLAQTVGPQRKSTTRGGLRFATFVVIALTALCFVLAVVA